MRHLGVVELTSIGWKLPAIHLVLLVASIKTIFVEVPEILNELKGLTPPEAYPPIVLDIE
jgi:hypothetical protein